ncbi:MAG: hypothetical protein U0744_00020 [Gemmataceae bacterium]
MEALRDRTVKIDVPYVTRLSDEIKIYEKSFSQERVKGKHLVAPHDQVAAMWAIPASNGRSTPADRCCRSPTLQRQDAARVYRGQRHRA